MVENLTIEKWVILSYFIVGTLFIFYFFAIFIQKSIRNSLRLTLSILFITIGMLFFNMAGKMMYGESNQLSIISIINAILLAAVGMVCVYIIYRENKRNKIKNINENDNDYETFT